MAMLNASGTMAIAMDNIGSNLTTASAVSIAEVKGTPIIVDYELSSYSLELTDENHIKLKLCELLVEELFCKGMIEFTRESFPHVDNTKFRARIFVTPKDITQLLRVNKTIP